MYLTTDIINKDVRRLSNASSDVRLFGYISDRNGRKSSSFQFRVIENALNGKPSVIFRNKTNRPITEKWFSDYVAEYIKNQNWYCYSEKIDVFKGAMTVTYIVTDADEPDDNTYILYYGMYLSVSDIYKSNFYPGWDKVDDFIFEEAVPTERLIQDERHIVTNSMKQMFDLLSIVSTVSRGRKVNCFLLGNDIAYNLLNPLTVSFDLLERIEINKRIIDKCTINDMLYDFMFLYFDFPGAVNHWLTDSDKKIDSTVPVDGLSFRQFGFKTRFKSYMIYDYNGRLYVSDIQPRTSEGIRTRKELLSVLGYTDYLFSPEIQIEVLRSRGTDSEKELINKYIDQRGRFRVPKVDEAVKYFDLDEILKMKMHEIDRMPDGETFKALILEIVTTKSVFSNYKIKTILTQIYYDFEIYKETC